MNNRVERRWISESLQDPEYYESALNVEEVSNPLDENNVFSQLYGVYNDKNSERKKRFFWRKPKYNNANR